MKIIIAEDEQRARKGIEDQIRLLGEEYSVVGTASDGRKALDLIRSLHPDVVFTDVRMPFVNGLELIKRCREEGIQTEFVIISAHAEFEFARQACSLGVTEYLLKPLSVEDLQNTLTFLQAKISGKGVHRHQQYSPLVERYPGIHPLIRKALEYIEQHYNDRISQKEIAGILNISPEYLSFLFKKEIGENFAKFLQNYRIEVARQLMDAGNKDAEEIAAMVGFSDGKYFSKVFKENVGVSVREYLIQ